MILLLLKLMAALGSYLASSFCKALNTAGHSPFSPFLLSLLWFYSSLIFLLPHGPHFFQIPLPSVLASELLEVGNVSYRDHLWSTSIESRSWHTLISTQSLITRSSVGALQILSGAPSFPLYRTL